MCRRGTPNSSALLTVSVPEAKPETCSWKVCSSGTSMLASLRAKQCLCTAGQPQVTMQSSLIGTGRRCCMNSPGLNPSRSSSRGGHLRASLA